MIEQLRLIPAREPADILDRAFALHKPRAAWVLLSGGKDSSVLAHVMASRFRSALTGILHINTGIGIRSTNEFARTFAATLGLEYAEVSPRTRYEDMVRQFGFPGPGFHALPYNELKGDPLGAFVKAQKVKRRDAIVLITGVRAEESERRMGQSIDVARDDRGKVWVAPLIDWSNRAMMDYRDTNAVPMSPAARMIHISGECLCGAFGSPSELPIISLVDEEPVARIRTLEAELTAAGHPRCRWAVKVSGDPEPSAPPPRSTLRRLRIDKPAPIR